MHMLISGSKPKSARSLGPSKGSVGTQNKSDRCREEVPGCCAMTGGTEDSSNGLGILDIDLRWNTRCNLSKKEITTRTPNVCRQVLSFRGGRKRNRMFDIFSIKDVGINEKKVKQPLRSPKHAWCHRSQTGPKNLTNNNEDKKASFEERILQQFGEQRESIQRNKGRRV